MGFEGLGDLMRSRCLVKRRRSPVGFLLKPVCDAAHFRENFVGAVNAMSVAAVRVNNQIVRPLESTAETQPQLHPALLSLSAMISQCFTTRSDSQSCVCINDELPVVLVRLLLDRFCVSCC